MSVVDIEWWKLIMGLAGGLALFLLGMAQVTDALKALGDDRLRWALAKLSSNRFMGATTGALVTAVIQSSSVTTVLTVGFVSAGLLSLTQAAGVIIGANLGTTVTAQVIALKITDYALGLLAFGAILGVVVQTRQAKYLGRALVGLGFVFLGMEIMSDAMSPLRTYQPFLDLMSGSTNAFTGVAMGAVFTGLVQSSSATTGIVVVMAADGLIDLNTAIAIILGANIGTCVTALLASIGKGVESRRTAMVHVIVNVLGAAVAIFLIGALADLVQSISPSEDTASPRQIANAHTVFNLANTVVFLAFLGPLVALARRVVPERVRRSAELGEVAFLDEDLIETPVLALEVAHKELMRMGLQVRNLLSEAVPAAMTGKRADLERLRADEAKIDDLHGAIIDYLSDVGQRSLGPEQQDDILALLSAVNAMEQLSDTIETQVINKGIDRIEKMIEVSQPTRERIEELYQAALETLDLALEAVGDRSWTLSTEVLESKREFKELKQSASEHLAARLASGEPRRVEAYSFEIELVEALNLVHRSCRRIARDIRLPENLDDATGRFGVQGEHDDSAQTHATTTSTP